MVWSHSQWAGWNLWVPYRFGDLLARGKVGGGGIQHPSVEVVEIYIQCWAQQHAPL